MPEPTVNDGFVEMASPGLPANVTSITLKTGHGSRLPDPAALGAFTLTFFEAAVGHASKALHAGKGKRVRVTARAGDVLTVVDGAEGSSTAAMPTVDTGLLAMTAAALEAFRFHCTNAGDWTIQSGSGLIGARLNAGLVSMNSGGNYWPERIVTTGFGKVLTISAGSGGTSWIWLNGNGGSPVSPDRFSLIGDGSLYNALGLENTARRFVSTWFGSGFSDGLGPGYIWREIG